MQLPSLKRAAQSAASTLARPSSRPYSHLAAGGAPRKNAPGCFSGTLFSLNFRPEPPENTNRLLSCSYADSTNLQTSAPSHLQKTHFFLSPSCTPQAEVGVSVEVPSALNHTIPLDSPSSRFPLGYETPLSDWGIRKNKLSFTDPNLRETGDTLRLPGRPPSPPVEGDGSRPVGIEEAESDRCRTNWLPPSSLGKGEGQRGRGGASEPSSPPLPVECQPTKKFYNEQLKRIKYKPGLKKRQCGEFWKYYQKRWRKISRSAVWFPTERGRFKLSHRVI
mmetsp:Transcript_3148/g.6521  ORF Transcript_3148/g.6521 Transcript_3148/m.6521 type:complete len:277 (+) Transcript_3148:248-1078(+)